MRILYRLTFTIVVALATVGALADTVAWRGVNTVYLANELGSPPEGETHDLTPYQQAGTAGLWDSGEVPSAGDTARLIFDSTQNYVWGDVFLDGAFSPDHVQARAVGAGPIGAANATIHVSDDLSFQTLGLEFGHQTSGGDGNLRVAEGKRLSLTGERPLSFGGDRGAWATISLGAGAMLTFPSLAHTFDSYNTTYAHGWSAFQGFRALSGSGGYVDFTNPATVVTLGDPGTARDRISGGDASSEVTAPAIDLGVHTLRVRSGQQWSSGSAGNALIRAISGTDASLPRTLVQAIDGPLPDLSGVSFMIRRTATTGITTTYYIPGTAYQALHVITSGHSWHNSAFRLTGNVQLMGGVPLLVRDSGGTVTGSAPCDDGLILEARGNGFSTYLDGNALSVERGLLLQSSTGGDFADRARLEVSGAVLNVGGNLRVHSTTRQAGTASETRRVGLVGNAATVINLGGNYETTVRSLASTEGSLHLSTLNMTGGTEGNPATFEVAAAPGDSVVAGTHAIGTVRIGTNGAPAQVQLVNANLNDSQALDGEGARTKEGEALLATSLAIGPGSTLDLNGQRVKLADAFTMGAAAQLDLNTGLDLEIGDLVPTFTAEGDQTSIWSAYRDRVLDSSMSGVSFVPVVAGGEPLPFGGSTALNFDGINDYVDLRTHGDGLGTTVSAFTIEMWVRAVPGPGANGGYGYLMIRTSATGATPAIGTSLYWLGINNSGRYAAGVNGNFGGGDTGVEANTDTWRHLALVRDGGTQHVYVDGELKATASVGATQSTNIGNLGIGSAPTAPTYRPVQGRIGEVRIWNVARTQAEIQGTRLQRLVGNEAGLAAYWPLNDGIGTTADDRTSGGRDGTLMGASWPGTTYWQVAPGGATLLLVR